MSKVSYMSAFVFLGALLIASLIGCSSDDSETGAGPEDVTDDKAPAAVSDLAVDSARLGFAYLSWTAVGDDSVFGLATSYDLRYDTDSAVLLGWSDARKVSAVRDPRYAGSAETIVVGNLWPDSVYYFAIKAGDEEDNLSAMSNVAIREPTGDAAVQFPDVGLETAIRERLNRQQGMIFASELLSIGSLWASHRNISDLSGLEYLGNLGFLDLEGNAISDLDVLSEVSALQILYLNNNQIVDVGPLASLTHLTGLRIDMNEITDIDSLASLADLQELSLGGNQIADIDAISGLTNLENLALDENNVSDIGVLSGLTNLADIGLTGNDISDIGPLVDNVGLGDGDIVYLYGNPLSDLSINEYIPTLEARGVVVQY